MIQRCRMMGDVPCNHVVKLPQGHGRQLARFSIREFGINVAVNQGHGLFTEPHPFNDFLVGLTG